jgi:hypothetical protein
VGTRAQNERKFDQWRELPGGGRLYWSVVTGRRRGSAQYFKEVDQAERTVHFWQKIFDEHGHLIATHEKDPLDKGPRNHSFPPVKITRQTAARKLDAYLKGRLTLAALVDWAKDAMCWGEFESPHVATLRDVVGRLGLADVRAFSLDWDECVRLLRRLGYRARVEVAPA